MAELTRTDLDILGGLLTSIDDFRDGNRRTIWLRGVYAGKEYQGGAEKLLGLYDAAGPPDIAARSFLSKAANFDFADGRVALGLLIECMMANFDRSKGEQLKDIIERYKLLPPAKTNEDLPSPYPGLEAFKLEQAELFFGRARESARLATKIIEDNCHFVFITGASGIGKSSLVAAGLIPILCRQEINPAWNWLRMLPGNDRNPFVALAWELKDTLERRGERPAGFAARLQQAQDVAVGELLLEALHHQKPSGSRCLLYIDQFEECFTQIDCSLAAPFFEFLADAAAHPDIYVIVTIRSDFLQQCVENETLAALLDNGLYTVKNPSQMALIEMIEQPAALRDLI